MSERLIAIVKELRHEESQLEQTKTKLREQLSAVEQRVSQIQEALTALGEKPKPKSARKTNSPPAKPAATKDDVVLALRQVIQSNAQLNEEQARKLVEKKIVSLGKSRTGFSLRFGEALKTIASDKQVS